MNEAELRASAPDAVRVTTSENELSGETRGARIRFRDGTLDTDPDA